MKPTPAHYAEATYILNSWRRHRPTLVALAIKFTKQWVIKKPSK